MDKLNGTYDDLTLLGDFNEEYCWAFTNIYNLKNLVNQNT